MVELTFTHASFLLVETKPLQTLLYCTVLSFFSRHNTSKAVSLFLFFWNESGGWRQKSVTAQANIFRGSPTGRQRKQLHSLAPCGARLPFRATKIPAPTHSRPPFRHPTPPVGNPDCHARELNGRRQTRRRAYRTEKPFPPKL